MKFQKRFDEADYINISCFYYMLFSCYLAVGGVLQFLGGLLLVFYFRLYNMGLSVSRLTNWFFSQHIVRATHNRASLEEIRDYAEKGGRPSE